MNFLLAVRMVSDDDALQVRIGLNQVAEISLGDLRKEPAKIRERLLAEFDLFARFAPVIDKLVKAL